MTVIDDLRRVREAIGMSHREVAERMGRPELRSLVCDWERRVKTPRLQSLEAWAEALGRSITLVRVAGAPPDRTCPRCRGPVRGHASRVYCSYRCRLDVHAERIRAGRAAAKVKAAAELDPLVAAAIRATHSLYGGTADEIVHALDLTDPAAIAYARQVCGEVRT